ncbi:MAG: hypothetical protein ACXVB9_20875 [Bdellovibrionota bacterium]
MISFALALLLASSPAFAAIQSGNEYANLKGAAVRVDLLRPGKSLATYEKQEGAKICQRISSTYSCYEVRALGRDAVTIYNSSAGVEMSLIFRDEDGRPLVGTQSAQKFTADGFCRRSLAVSSYVCYSRI